MSEPDETETGPSLPAGLVAAGKAVGIVSSIVGEAVTLQQFLGKPHAVLALLLLSLFFAIVVFVALSPGKRKLAAAPVVLGFAVLVTMSAFHTTRQPSAGVGGGVVVSSSSASSAVAPNGTGAASSPSTVPTACCTTSQTGQATSASTATFSTSTPTGTTTGPGPRPTTAPDPPATRTTSAPSTTPGTTSSAPAPPCCTPPPTSSTGSTDPATQDPAVHNSGELTLPNDGSSADLDSTARDWGIHKGTWTGAGIAYGGTDLGLDGSPYNTALMGSGGGWTYASCRNGAPYGAAPEGAQGTAIDPGHGICYWTRAGRQALMVVKSRTDSAITLDVTVWD
jgi:hypothetical protein